jgi:hypothetical protein
MNAFEVPATTVCKNQQHAASAKKDDDMTKTEIKNDILTDVELDGVVGGLNPQPLPPEPPPEGLHSFATNRFEFARFSFF